jgi:hypothetical protein
MTLNMVALVQPKFARSFGKGLETVVEFFRNAPDVIIEDTQYLIKYPYLFAKNAFAQAMFNNPKKPDDDLLHNLLYLGKSIYDAVGFGFTGFYMAASKTRATTRLAYLLFAGGMLAAANMACGSLDNSAVASNAISRIQPLPSECGTPNLIVIHQNMGWLEVISNKLVGLSEFYKKVGDNHFPWNEFISRVKELTKEYFSHPQFIEYGRDFLPSITRNGELRYLANSKFDWVRTATYCYP